MSQTDEPVSKFIYPKLTVIDSKLSITQAEKELQEKRMESALVFENDSLIGIITERDILYDVVAKGLDPSATLVKQIVNKPLITINKDARVLDAINLMKQKKIRRLIVVDGKKTVGLIRRKQLSGILEVRDVLIPELEDPQKIIRPYC